MISISDIPAELRAAPSWAIIVGAILLVVLIVGAGPFAGLCIERSRRAAALRAGRQGSATRENFFAGQPDLGQRFGALDVTFAGRPKSPERLSVTYVDSAPTVVIKTVETTRVMEVEVFRYQEPALFEAPEPADESPKPWAEMQHTQEWNFVQVYGADLEEAESDALKAFAADPLGSWVIPPEDDEVSEVEFEKSFRRMVALGILTGYGIETDNHVWKSWNLEGAS